MMPGVDFRLQIIAPCQQSGVARRQPMHERGETIPKRLWIDAGVGNGFLVDEVVQGLVYLNLADRDGRCHLRDSGLAK